MGMLKFFEYDVYALLDIDDIFSFVNPCVDIRFYIFPDTFWNLFLSQPLFLVMWWLRGFF